MTNGEGPRKACCTPARSAVDGAPGRGAADTRPQECATGGGRSNGDDGGMRAPGISQTPPLSALVVEPSAPRRPDNVRLVLIDVPGFRMGTDGDEGFAGDGEGPSRLVRCDPFRISATAVTNAEFAAFVTATGYRTEAERHGASFVFRGLALPEAVAAATATPVGMPWWLQMPGACWHRPEGPGSDIDARGDHPVVHVSWNDAIAYCRWAACRLPTEAEWECAARGGLEGRRYPWGDELTPGGEHRCNIWQGEFPSRNTVDDGYTGTAPVDAFTPNGHGLYNMAGNVWEWCADWFSPNYHRVTRAMNPIYLVPTGSRSMRGGSYLCHASYCNRYRVAARNANTPDSSMGNVGFRVAAGA